MSDNEMERDIPVDNELDMDTIDDGKVDITREQYWKMYADMEELNHAKTKLKLKELEFRAKQLEGIIAEKNLESAKLELMKEQEAYKDSEKSYADERSKLEDELGIPLENTVLNPFTGNLERI